MLNIQCSSEKKNTKQRTTIRECRGQWPVDCEHNSRSTGHTSTLVYGVKEPAPPDFVEHRFMLF
jgi:hypothetical protein